MCFMHENKMVSWSHRQNGRGCVVVRPAIKLTVIPPAVKYIDPFSAFTSAAVSCYVTVMTRQKIFSRDDLIAWRQAERQAGHRVVWTNGCFDLLHPGHVASLQAAREQGQRLIVGINSDASVRANKGPTRPVMTELDRAKMLAALECVDAVTIFDEETPEQILMALQPDVHCKGAEYAPPHGRPVPEAKIVAAYGGTIVYLPLVPGISTTAILERLRKAA